MTKLLILEKGDRIRDFLAPIKKLPEFSSLEINSYSAETSGDGLIIEFSGELKEIKDYLSFPIILAYVPSQTDQEKLEQFVLENNDIYGLLDLEKGLGLSLPLLKEFLELKEKSLELEQLEKKVKRLKKDASSQLEIIKKTFEKVVPVRTSKNNGVNIYVKFTSGLSQGGEFFDFLNASLQSLIIWNRSVTYQGSNNFLDHFKNWEKDSYDLLVLKDFVLDLNPEEGQEIFLGQIDLKTLTFEGLNFSDCFFYFAGDKEIIKTSFDDPRPFKIRLERGERFIILSSGAMENFAKLSPDLNIRQKLGELSLLSPREVLDEIFFELKRNLKKKFLPNDAAIILVEVDKNVIFQV